MFGVSFDTKEENDAFACKFSFPFPLLFVLLMPTVTVTLVLLPVGLIMYAQILYYIGSAAATSVVKERSNGTRDLLLSPTVMMHRALRRAGIEAELHVFEAMPHGGLGGSSPEDAELQEEIASFLKRKLGVN